LTTKFGQRINGTKCFGANYKVIVPLVSFHEEEFDLGSIGVNNELVSLRLL
jgi:hypothetical protein